MLRRSLSILFAFLFVLLPCSISTGAAQPATPPIQYLLAHPPGPWSLVISSLSNTTHREDAQKQLQTLIENGFSNGFSNALSLEQAIITLCMLGENPENDPGNHLISRLAVYDNLTDGSLETVCFALIAYQAAQASVLETSRNAPPALTDFIVSSQQRTGGFAPIAGKSPCPQSTAEALLALTPQKDLPYVKSSIDRAINWLSQTQNSDGSFSKSRMPSCEATAAVLTALRAYGISADDPRFVKDAGLLDALSAFQKPDGGYASHPDEPSSVKATETAVLALYAHESGQSPYLPAQTSASEPPSEEVQDPIAIYLKFLFTFLMMLAIIYGLLILTTKLAKPSDRSLPKFKNPYTLDDDEISSPENDTQTMEINIPMQAAMPNFDEIGEPPGLSFSEKEKHTSFLESSKDDNNKKPLE